MVVGAGASGKWWGHEGGAPMIGLVPLLKYIFLSLCSPACKNTARRGLCEPGIGVLSGHWTWRCLGLGLPTSGTVRNKYLLFRSHPVCGVLWQQLELTMTGCHCSSDRENKTGWEYRGQAIWLLHFWLKRNHVILIYTKEEVKTYRLKLMLFSYQKWEVIICSVVFGTQTKMFKTIKKNNINGATLEWSQSCHPRGAALHIAASTLWNVETGKMSSGLGLSNLVSRRTVCKNKKAVVMATRLMTTEQKIKNIV